METIIKANSLLYPKVDGTIVDQKCVGETVVANGIVNPNNVCSSSDPETGEINITLTSGDRSQLMSPRGQEVDWIIAAVASDPDEQMAIVDEFMNFQREQKCDYNKELRGLAMHVMYRSISEAHWFAEHGHGKMTEAENLVKLASQIIKGEGRWEGVNKLMKQE